MCVVGLPGGEEHWQAGDHCRKCPSLARAETHSSCLEKTGQCAIQRVDTMIEELTQWTRRASTSRLFPVNVVHSRVHPDPCREAVVDP